MLRFGSLIPQIAQHADKLALIRSMTHGEAAHERAVRTEDDGKAVAGDLDRARHGPRRGDLGLAPVLEHDDYEYTYPSFSFAAHGHYGSPLLGPGFNIERRPDASVVTSVSVPTGPSASTFSWMTSCDHRA